jgi:predicted nucleotidyltransferase
MHKQEDGIIRKLYNKKKLNVSQEFAKDVHFEGIHGSFAYGISGDTSDCDVIGLCVPPIEYIFPHTAGYIPGFGLEPPKFKTFQEHHIKDNDKEYDVAIYNLVEFFELAAGNNPNLIDVLFLPERCITHCDNIGKYVRQNRKLFLTRGSFHRFIGYAYAQMKLIDRRHPKESRTELVEKYGYDTKYGSHLVRLALECEQILQEHDLDIERNSEILKAIRRGEWTLDRVKEWFAQKELQLNELYSTSTLRYKPEWQKLTDVLMCCLEEKFGSLSKIISTGADARVMRVFEQIKALVNGVEIK